ncbi:MAG TPA: hypothetical protein EYG51_25255 [Pseudomonadales bacterium]|nr:hypothetical protein [Pseudomonadales bacterium]
MAAFQNTKSPTPFGFFNADSHFQTEANAMVTFVKRKMGDDILSVELTRKQIWACFEESFLEYGKIVNEYQAQSQLMTLLGFPTGSYTSGSFKVGPNGQEQKFPRENLEFMLRRAEPFASDAGFGGSYNTISGSLQLSASMQDYDIYQDLKDADGNVIFETQTAGSKTKMKIMEVYHFSPQAAYRFFDTTSAINYLNNEFSFASFTPETVFYVLPVFEDILRGGQLDLSNRVRRSNYSYRVSGTKIRIFPQPTQPNPLKLWIKVALSPDPMSPAYTDDTIEGVSNLSNVPYGNLQFQRVNSMGRQWCRQYTLALSKELLGLIRSKFASVPIPGSDLQLNGSELVTQGREDQEKLKTTLRETLDGLTYGKLLETEVAAADNLMKILRGIPIPNGKAIIMG